MPTIKDTAATSALNEKEYLNKLYDGTNQTQKDVLKEGYEASTQQLNSGKDTTQKLTDAYLDRTNVEAARNQQGYSTTPIASGASKTAANAQARLSLGNQQKANTTALNQQQAAADAEFETRRKMLAEKYASQIKQAQAENDMGRAQALYEAAKAEEEQLRTLRQNAAELMAKKGDESIYEAIANGEQVTPDTTTPTWDGVLKNEADINKIYDAQIESQRLKAQQERNEAMGEIDITQAQAEATTDKNLTNAYVDALKKGKNYMETQNAYGQGSGTAAQAQIARDNELTEKLTSLRTLQTGQTADRENKRLALAQTYAEAIANAQASGDTARVKALYEAAEKEEQNLVADQQLAGEYYAKKGDYSILGKLYGLTDEQMKKLTRKSGGSSKKKSTGGGGPGTGDGGSGTGNLSGALASDLIWYRNS